MRFAQREVEATLADTPITVLQCARQVGKSTLAKTVTAGRAQTVVLYGFSQGELSGNREDFVDRVMAGDIANLLGREGALVRRDYLELACAGSYPEPITRSGRRRNAWFNNYIQRIVTIDAEEFNNLAHLDRLVAGIEMKSSGSPGTSDFRHLKLLREKLGDRFRIGVVLYTGRAALPFGARVQLRTWPDVSIRQRSSGPDLQRSSKRIR